MGNTITSIVDGDIFFPDNPQREARLKELCGDMDRLVAENTEAYEIVGQAAATIDAKLVQYGINPDTLPGNGDAFRRNAQLFPLYTEPHAQSALDLGFSCSSGGENGVLAELFPFMGLTSPVLLSVLNGEERRSKLREGIAGALPARLKLQGSLIVNHKLVTCLHAIQDSLQVLLQVEGLPSETVKEKLHDMAEEQARTISLQDPSKESMDHLDDLDRKRNSWTNEDVHFGLQT